MKYRATGARPEDVWWRHVVSPSVIGASEVARAGAAGTSVRLLAVKIHTARMGSKKLSHFRSKNKKEILTKHI